MLIFYPTHGKRVTILRNALAETAPVFVVVMVALLLSLGVGMLASGLPIRGALWSFALAGALAALTGIGIGVTIATISKSQQQAQLLTFSVNPPLTLLSGVPSPLENMPDVFQKLSDLDPLRYMVTMIRGHIEECVVGSTVAESARAGSVCDCALLV